MVQTRVFGRHDGQDVIEATLVDGDTAVSILNYGCVVRDWRVQSGQGEIPTVLGFDRFEDYPEHSRSFGVIAGRVANRTARGHFELDGKTYQLPINNGPNHLHGGLVGLGRRVWKLEPDTAGNAVHLIYHSPDGEEGYPGAVDFRMTYKLSGSALSLEMVGQPDQPTPINLAQHSYYNLNGAGDILQHRVEIRADRYTPTDETQIPTGEIAPVLGTRFDFRTETTCAANDPGSLGIDHNLVLEEDRNLVDPAATVRADKTDLVLRLWTHEPGVQMFNAPTMDIPVPGIGGRRYGKFGGLCLEAQHFPDSLHRPEWPSIISTPESPYYQKLIVDISRG